MKKNEKIKLVFLLFFTISLFCFSQFKIESKGSNTTTSPVGLEFSQNDILHIWNELNDYYINISNFKILYKYPQTWSDSIFCIQINPQSEGIKKCINSNWNWNFKTDYKKYVELNGTTHYSEKSFSGILEVILNLSWYDPMLNVSFSFKNTGNDIENFYFGLIFENLDKDVQNEFLITEKNGTTFYFDLSTLNLSILDFPKNYLELKNNATKSWLYISWDGYTWKNNEKTNNLILFDFDKTQTNYSLLLMVRASNIKKNDLVSANFLIGYGVEPDVSVIIESYENFVEKLKTQTQESYLFGKELYLQDVYTEIAYDGEYIRGEEKINQTNIKNLNGSVYYAIIPIYKFLCFKYPTTDLFDTTICPDWNKRTKYFEFFQKELENKSFEENISHSFGRYIKVDDKSGVLIDYYFDSFPSEKTIYEIERLKPSKIFEYLNEKELTESLNYTIYFGPGKCVELPINRFSNFRLNITMPSTIKNYSLGNYPEIITNYVLNDNNLIVNIRPYPCCGIKNMTIQWLKVCY